MHKLSTFIILFSTSLLFLASCGTSKDKDEKKIELTGKTSSSYFEGSGSEPFWAIELTQEQLVLTQLDKETITAQLGKNESEKENERIYSFKDSGIDYQLTITKKKCMNSSSGEKSDFGVAIKCDKEEKNSEILSGCGDYKVEKQLHDIWVLEEMNGKKISSKEFPSEFPRMEIQAEEQSFIGFTGCNQMFGKINIQDGAFSFSDVGATKMYCEGVSESEFLETLGLVTSYQRKNTKLMFFGEKGLLLIFKKVD